MEATPRQAWLTRWWPVLFAVGLGLLHPALAVAFASIMAFLTRHDRPVALTLLTIVAVALLWYSMFAGAGGGGFGSGG